MLPNSAGNIGNFNIDNVAVRRVPEPASGLLFSMAAALVVLSRRRMRAHKRFA
jgi:hypothetical protein